MLPHLSYNVKDLSNFILTGSPQMAPMGLVIRASQVRRLMDSACLDRGRPDHAATPGLSAESLSNGLGSHTRRVKNVWRKVER